MQNELTDPGYWDKNWQATELPRVVQPFKTPTEGQFARLFQKYIPKGGRCLEIGCAASPWLPFFASRMGYEPWGVDYSPLGLRLAEANMEMLSIPSHFVLGDFAETKLSPDSFRLICSFGVVEHYHDPSPIFKKAFDLLEPGGLIITVIPNLIGFLGPTLKAINRPVYDVHVRFSPSDMDRLHAGVGFQTVFASQPFGIFGLGTLTWQSIYPRLPGFTRRPFAYLIQYAERLIGWATWWGAGTLDHIQTSPYIVGIYKKPSR